MNKVYAEKCVFVSLYLNLLVRQIDRDIKRLVYLRNETTETEVVTIHYSDGNFKSIDVTADSLKAITTDVMKHI